MHVFEVLFLYCHEDSAELFFLPRPDLNSADLRGNSEPLNFTKTTLQKMIMTATERYDTKNTSQMKMTPA